MIDDYLCTLNAAGQRAETIKARGDCLRRIARNLGGDPQAVTAEALVDWFGAQQWAVETRRCHRSAARGFFAWAYKTRRVSDYLGDELPKIRMPAAAPRPAPDSAWMAALASASPRTTLMLRLAGEAGLRRAEVARVHTRDLIDDAYPRLVVDGKGGKQRIVPISAGLAELIARGAAGHTEGMPERGWLFPTGYGGHLTAQYVGLVVAAALPDNWTMHTLRHRYASRAYRGTRNLRAVQTLLGHASIATTERYTAVDDSEMRAAMVAAVGDG
jgi:integrase/recombinase XerC